MRGFFEPLIPPNAAKLLFFADVAKFFLCFYAFLHIFLIYIRWLFGCLVVWLFGGLVVWWSEYSEYSDPSDVAGAERPQANNSSTRLLVYSSTNTSSTNNSSTRQLITRLLVYLSTRQLIPRLLVHSSTNTSSTCPLVH